MTYPIDAKRWYVQQYLFLFINNLTDFGVQHVLALIFLVLMRTILWCGTVRYGTVRCGAVRCDVLRCAALHSGVVRCGATWCGVVWCGVAWRGVAWRSAAYYKMHASAAATANSGTPAAGNSTQRCACFSSSFNRNEMHNDNTHVISSQHICSYSYDAKHKPRRSAGCRSSWCGRATRRRWRETICTGPNSPLPELWCYDMISICYNTIWHNSMI